jgi:hypothetical protein
MSDFIFEQAHQLPYGQAVGNTAAACSSENLHCVIRRMREMPIPEDGKRALLMQQALLAAQEELANRLPSRMSDAVKIVKLRTALEEMVGESDPEKLLTMEAMLKAIDMPEDDRVKTIGAVRALLETL